MKKIIKEINNSIFKSRCAKIVKKLSDDEILVNDTLNTIRDTYIQNVKDSYKKIGNCLAEIFFNGNIEEIRRKRFANGKGKSFQKLCEKLKNEGDNLPKKSYLYNALGLHVDHHLLEETVVFHTYGKLPVSHQIQLLTVRDLEKKKELIQEIGDAPCSVRDLKEMIKEILPKKENKSARTDIEKFLDNLKKGLEKKLEHLDNISATDDENTAIAAIHDEMSRTIDLISECRENCQFNS